MGTDAAQPYIVVTPIGEIESTLCDSISREVENFFGLPTRIVTLLNNVEFAFDPGRSQYYSTRILEKLADDAPKWAVKLIGITKVDLFIPILTYVYGEAQLGGRASIISTCRLNERPYASRRQLSLQERIIKEALHELGHTFKLRHCPDHRCTMHYCRSVQDVDRKTKGLCRHCTVMLGDELKRLKVDR